MSEDVLTSESPWPELAELDDFWEADDTPPRGVQRIDADDEDDDPTPVNARRPVFTPTLPPPTTLPVAGPPPVAMAEPLSLPNGAPLVPPPFTATASPPQRRWPRRLGALAIVAGLAAAAVFGWQWNEGRHDAASAARVLPSEPVDAPDLNLIEFEVDRSVDASVRVDLASGDALAVVSGGLSVARADDGFWTRELGVEKWTPATSAFLERNALIVEMIENASVLTVSEVFPPEIHPHLRIVNDVSVADPDVVPTGSSVLDVGSDGNIRQLIIQIDRNALNAAEPVLARRLNLAGEGLVDVEIWLDRTGVVRRLSAPVGVTIAGGEYRLVSAGTDGAGPLDDFDPEAFEIVLPDVEPDIDAPELVEPAIDGTETVPLSGD